MKVNLAAMLLFLMLFLHLNSSAGEFPEKTINKAEKFAAKIWSDQSIEQAGQIQFESLVSNLTSDYYSSQDTLFRITDGSSATLGYLLISAAKGRFEFFDFMMVYNPGIELIDIRILTYRSEYGSQVTSKAWLRKFCEISPTTEIQYGKDIDAVSGASFSASSLTREVDRINKLMLELLK